MHIPINNTRLKKTTAHRVQKQEKKESNDVLES